MSYLGMDPRTGKEITGIEHVTVCLRNLFQTSPRTLPLLLDYGSKLRSLVDKPVTEEFRLEVSVAIVEAIEKEEPRLRPVRVTLSGDLKAGDAFVELEAIYYPLGHLGNHDAQENVNLKVPL
ncbi:GPW/gp25 family protein [Pseudovibrio ascidiaceicola]|uniref:GPW/gp25 family protein n=1 Tax=Pseudovibrio ascidiaceicola TaxID=285279 RepID=UPI003D35E58B